MTLGYSTADQAISLGQASAKAPSQSPRERFLASEEGAAVDVDHLGGQVAGFG
jgi:hypothetical protein